MVMNQGAGAKDRAAQTAAAAKDQAAKVTSSAADQARDVASTAGDHTRQLVDEARGQAMSLVGEAKEAVRRQGESQSGQLADAIGQLGEQARALLDGRPEEAPMLAERAQRAVDQLDRLSERVRSGGLDGAARDLQRFARRRPMAFLVGAGVAGFAVGRVLRANRESDDTTPAPVDTQAALLTSYPPPPPMPLTDESTLPVTLGATDDVLDPVPASPTSPYLEQG